MHDLKIARQKAWIERRRAESALAPAEPAPTPKAAPVPVPVRLPAWPESVRAVPNGFLRSALFGAIKRGARRYLKAELVAAVEGTEIRYTGERLDQGDLDVWESVLHAVRTQELGSQCRVTSYALLKLMGLTDTGKNRATLHTRITRLVANAVEVKQGRYVHRRPDSLRGQGRGDAGMGDRAGRQAAPAVRRRPVHAGGMGRASGAQRPAAGPVAAWFLRQPREAVSDAHGDAAKAIRQ